MSEMWNIISKVSTVPTMERYHMFKLGFAILFYAAYCIRPMMAQNHKNNTETKPNPNDFLIYYQGVEGKPGVDFPVYSYIPRTTFSCKELDSGYYADLDTDCQVFHICEEGKKISFLCPNGTIFQQSDLICEWWYKVNCSDAPSLYSGSAEQLRNDVARRKASRRIVLNGNEVNHGAVMRTEEARSISATKNGKKYEVKNEEFHVNQAVRGGKKVDNFKGNDLDQSEAVEESNNRHLANAQLNYIKNQEKTRNTNRNNGNGFGQKQRQKTNSFDSSFNNNNQQSTTSVPSNYNTVVQNNKEQKLNYRTTFASYSEQPSTTAAPFYGNNNQNNQQQTYSTIEDNNFGNNGGTNTNQFGHKQQNDKKTTLRDYHVQFSSTGSNFETSTQPSYQHSSKYQPFNFNTNSGRVSTTTPRVFSSTLNRGKVKFNSNDKNTSTTFVPYSQTYGTKIGVATTPKPIVTSTLNSVDYNTQKSTFNRGTAKYNSYKEETSTKPSNVYSSSYVPFSSTVNSNVDISTTPKYSESDTSFNFKVYSHTSSQNPNTPPDFPKHKIEEGKSIDKKETADLQESQITQESSSFIQNPFNSLKDDSKSSPNSFTNHKPVYSEVKSPNSLQASTKLNGISSVTPQFVTTQPINSGKPFLGSRVGTTIPSSTTTAAPEDNSKETIIVGVIRHTTANPEFGPPITKVEKELFNTGNVEKNLPPRIQKEEVNVNNPLPPSKFNVGNTDFTVLPSLTTPGIETKLPSFNINVPETGSFNTGQNTEPTEPTRFNVGSTETSFSTSPFPVTNGLSSTLPPFNLHISEAGSLNLGLNTTNNLVPVVEPEIIKKFVSPLYSTTQPTGSTPRPFNHVTVYGSFSEASSTTPSTPKVTVEVTNSVSSTPRTFTGGLVPIKFDKDSDKVQVQLSKTLGGTTENTPRSNIATFDKNSDRVTLQLSKSISEPRRKPLLTKPHVLSGGNDYVRFTVAQGSVKTKPAEEYQSTTSGNLVSSTASPNYSSTNGFFVTRGSFGDISTTTEPSRPSTLRPRGFQKSIDFSTSSFNSIAPTYPTYKISSAKPFEIPTTPPTLLPPKFSTYENVDNMINVLMEIAKIKDTNDYSFETPRPGLVVPPSAGPQTLHTLAQYFANALDDIVTDKEEAVNVETKEKISNLLTQMTVHGYNSLFKNRSDSTTTASPAVENATLETRFKTEEATSEADDVASTTELRELAKNFSIALSSYLNDPVTFKKDLEELRPTEPPTLVQDGSESNLENEELLNFSDTDTKSSFPPVFPTVPSVVPTWGFIIANKVNETNNDVKNSLNPDLNTADTQSFVPRYNDINSNEKTSTSLPPNHWTKSPGATKLWQKALSINPGDINDHFVTSTEPISAADSTRVPETDISAHDNLPRIDASLSEVKYELRALPQVSLNSTQVHGILIDFMNSTKQDESNRLIRILKKLNTSEEEFLSRMKEIESNPITKRLILLLISECGADVTKDLGSIPENQDSLETLKTSSSGSFFNNRNQEIIHKGPNSGFQKLVNPNLSEDNQDTRALQLLNSLYSIASKFGK